MQHDPVGARSRFVDGNRGPLTVRSMVRASWERSVALRVGAECLDVPFVGITDDETPLVRAATAVLDALHQQLADEPVSTMLADADGVILVRQASHGGLISRLDRADLTAGHVFSEAAVGTNGIGTALAGAVPVTIDGPEHFVAELTGFRCTAVPIRHPVRRTVVGAFNITTEAGRGSDSTALAPALAASTALHIEQELALLCSDRERALFERYLDTCRRFRHTAVLAVDTQVLLMNDRLRTAVVGVDQTALIERIQEVGEALREVTLPSGLVVELRTVPGPEGGAGQVVAVRPAGRAPARSGPAPTRIVGLIGSAPTWLAAMAEVGDAHARRARICLLGEAGTGKAHLVTALHHSRGRGPCVLLEPPVEESDRADDDLLDTLRRSLRRPDELVVLRNVQWLSPRVRAALVDELRGRGDTARLALTAQPSALDPDDELLATCPVQVRVPSLRHRPDDVLALSRHFLRRYRPQRDLVLAPSAEHALQRFHWPGGVRQLEQVIRRVSRHSPAGRVEAADLPPELHASGRAALSPLQELERDAIVRGLVGHGRNVLRTARSLGISRATLYRRMRNYGIDPGQL